jgi:phospholipase/carboxylesterase
MGQIEVLRNRLDGLPDYVLLLLHGYGANLQDLAPLGQELELPPRTLTIFPNGLFPVPFAGPYEGRAWFPIDWEAMDRARRDGSYSAMRPAGLDESQAAILSLMKDLAMPLDRLILGGFSQGAMLALDVCLALPQAPLGLLLFSTTLLDRLRWQESARLKPGWRFFQSHGDQDPMLAAEEARKLHHLLLDAGWLGSLHRFQGGHEIPLSALRAANQSLGSWLSHQGQDPSAR